MAQTSHHHNQKQLLIWDEIDEQTERTVIRTLSVTKVEKCILQCIWMAGVFYFNAQFDYGRPTLDYAIELSNSLIPPQNIDDNMIKVFTILIEN